jgi:two-component sensor histidine kinase/CHASE1-domain containing sensor protein
VTGAAVAYYVTGKLGLLLAIPPGYATAVWPPSGIALAAALLGGYRVWPGILLGSFCVNIATSFDASSTATIARSLALTTSIGVGAALQAVAGAFLVRRFVGFPTALDGARDIINFLALGGPVSCLINATVAVTTLLIGGAISWTSYPFSWWTWWVGDVLGVFIFTPLLLIWMAEPREVWRPRWTSVALPLCTTFAVAVLVFFRVSSLEHKRIEFEFTRRAEILGEAVVRSLTAHIEVLHTLESFYAGSQTVERHGFHSFVKRLLARHPGIQALSWNPVVHDSERAAYEEAMRREGDPAFQITELNAQGQLVRAAQRTDYVTVSYIEPHEGNERALGFDVASDATRVEALRQAGDTGEPIATSRLTLVQETGWQFSVLIFLPIYRHGQPHNTVVERRHNLQGYMVEVLRLGDLVETALKTLERNGIELRLYEEMDEMDETAPPSSRLLYDSRSPLPGGTDDAFHNQNSKNPPGLHWSALIERVGRRWTIQVSATAEYLVAQRNWRAWVVLAAGLLFAGLLGAFLLSTDHTARIEGLVARRTMELEETNRALQGEILLRKQGEVVLAQHVQELERVNAALEHVAAVASKAEQTALASLKEKEVLLKEVHHRVKNNLQVICSLLNLQAGDIPEPQTREMFTDSQQRVRSMALVHEKLYQAEDLARIDFAEYVRSLATYLIRSYRPAATPITLRVEGAEVFLEVDKAVPCGLIVNELVSNALKHAFPAGRRGEICISLRAETKKHLILRVSDDGVGFPSGLDFRQTRSLGLQLVTTLIEQLQGTIELQHHSGTTFQLRFPAA